MIDPLANLCLMWCDYIPARFSFTFMIMASWVDSFFSRQSELELELARIVWSWHSSGERDGRQRKICCDGGGNGGVEPCRWKNSSKFRYVPQDRTKKKKKKPQRFSEKQPGGATGTSPHSVCSFIRWGDERVYVSNAQMSLALQNKCRVGGLVVCFLFSRDVVGSLPPRSVLWIPLLFYELLDLGTKCL